MQKLLFVDDEPRVLQGIRRLMRRYRAQLLIKTVDSADEALDELDREPYDVLVTDMRMPEMDGSELLRLVARIHPQVLRVVLSGHTELDAAVRVSHHAHRFLSKPCAAETLLETLNQVLRNPVFSARPTLRAFLGGLSVIPSPPDIVEEVQDALVAEDQDAVVRCCERDIGLSMQLLHLANWEFFGTKAPTTLREAVQRTGLSFLTEVQRNAGFAQKCPAALSLTMRDLNARAARDARHVTQNMLFSDDAGAVGDSPDAIHALLGVLPGVLKLLYRHKTHRALSPDDADMAAHYLRTIWRASPEGVALGEAAEAAG